MPLDGACLVPPQVRRRQCLAVSLTEAASPARTYCAGHISCCGPLQAAPRDRSPPSQVHLDISATIIPGLTALPFSMRSVAAGVLSWTSWREPLRVADGRGLAAHCCSTSCKQDVRIYSQSHGMSPTTTLVLLQCLYVCCTSATTLPCPETVTPRHGDREGADVS